MITTLIAWLVIINVLNVEMELTNVLLVLVLIEIVIIIVIVNQVFMITEVVLVNLVFIHVKTVLHKKHVHPVLIMTIEKLIVPVPMDFMNLTKIVNSVIINVELAQEFLQLVIPVLI